MRYIEFEEERVSIPIPDDWEIVIEPLGYRAWARTPDESTGVSAIGETKEEAIKLLAERMTQWLIMR